MEFSSFPQKKKTERDKKKKKEEEIKISGAKKFYRNHKKINIKSIHQHW